MPGKTYTTTLQLHAIPVPFDPKDTFGRVRAPVKVTLNGYTYRSTIAAMGGPPLIPFRRSHCEAAGPPFQPSEEKPVRGGGALGRRDGRSPARARYRTAGRDTAGGPEEGTPGETGRHPAPRSPRLHAPPPRVRE